MHVFMDMFIYCVGDIVFEPVILKCSFGLKLEIMVHKFNMEETSYT
jgi:hypothetical protein